MAIWLDTICLVCLIPRNSNKALNSSTVKLVKYFLCDWKGSTRRKIKVEIKSSTLLFLIGVPDTDHEWNRGINVDIVHTFESDPPTIWDSSQISLQNSTITKGDVWSTRSIDRTEMSSPFASSSSS
ncbi:hypothetical protein WICPIJ_003504 [Wickerhamomyces pijperi]|uniref:Uncharacterized protein n=1 Tax=Wickerhamomyces pijperi TaxID=599730 RepID=A0A9P8Q798_WICPI|nr:hypothetical protein WICPIJ_003504 [Wickerhamomyces pijperi]